MEIQPKLHDRKLGELTLFDATHKPPIYMTTDGKFAVFMGEIWITKDSIRGLKQALTKIKKSKSLRLMYVGEGTDAKVIDAIGIQNKYIIDRHGKKHYGSYGWRIYNAKAFELLKEYNARRKKIIEALDKEEEKITRRLHDVSTYRLKDDIEDKGVFDPGPLPKTK